MNVLYDAGNGELLPLDQAQALVDDTTAGDLAAANAMRFYEWQQKAPAWCGPSNDADPDPWDIVVLFGQPCVRRDALMVAVQIGNVPFFERVLDLPNIREAEPGTYEELLEAAQAVMFEIFEPDQPRILR